MVRRHICTNYITINFTNGTIFKHTGNTMSDFTDYHIRNKYSYYDEHNYNNCIKDETNTVFLTYHVAA